MIQEYDNERRVMMGTFKIVNEFVNEQVRGEQANPQDTEEVMELLILTAKWLHSQGSRQWSGLLEGQDSHNMAGCISQGEVFSFRQNNELVGVVILMQQPSPWDIDLWGESALDSRISIYLHRLAIKRTSAGQGLGKDILHWVEKDIEYNNKDRIRLDCIADNETLNRFYQRNGYTYIGEVKGYNKYETLLNKNI
ncbi:ribosomal protein S18 acetylase RimI-like enzyme [Paenibacillus sp. DS2015]|uniref:GNAT family N-acetyltransferase n=1 Tax=Paenibacillus sp. DS2015 TaxID=3373917 RepID=UPI003D1B30A2